MSKLGSGGCAVSSGQKRRALLPSCPVYWPGFTSFHSLALVMPQAAPRKPLWCSPTSYSGFSVASQTPTQHKLYRLDQQPIDRFGPCRDNQPLSKAGHGE